MSSPTEPSNTPTSTPSSTSVVNTETFLVTDMFEMFKHLHEIPCIPKAVGYGGVGGVFTGIFNYYFRSRSAFDGLVFGYMAFSTATFVTCRIKYEGELKAAKKLMTMQSKPVSAEEMREAERAHIAKLTAQNTSNEQNETKL